MKKLLVALTSCIVLICCMFTFAGCLPWFFVDTDTDAAKKDLEKIIKCLENNDHDGVKNLFAANRISDIEDFDDDIDELLIYYDGELVSYQTDFPSTQDDIDGKLRRKWFIITADVVTTTDTYFFSMYWCEKDTSDKNNVGIWTLYIFNIKDNPDKKYTFYDEPWGDEAINGIHIVKYVDGELISK